MILQEIGHDGVVTLIRKLYLAIAILWPFISLAGFIITVRANNFAIFSTSYSAIWFAIFPGLLILVVIGCALTGKAPARLWRLSLCVWIALVTWAHHTLVGVAAGGV